MRSHYCGHVNRAEIGRTVTVAGWVHRRRDHGGVIFIDLRDREGLLQVVFDPDRAEMFKEAERLRSEYVLAVEGTVRARPQGTVNPNLASGEVEVLAKKLTVLARAKTETHRLIRMQANWFRDDNPRIDWVDGADLDGVLAALERAARAPVP